MDEGASATQGPQQPGRRHAGQRGGLGRGRGGPWGRDGRGGRGRVSGRGWPQRHARAAADPNDGVRMAGASQAVNSAPPPALPLPHAAAAPPARPAAVAAAASSSRTSRAYTAASGRSQATTTLPSPSASEPTAYASADAPDPRIILLFDLNGTLTSQTSSRRSRGSNRARPGVQALLRLIPTFRLGIFSSATYRNVASAVAMLEQEAGVGPGQLFEHGLVLHRDHTQQLEGTDQHWDTCKPLSRWFAHLHRVVLVDDDAHKALPQEQRNLVHVPCWEDDDWQDDTLEVLVQALEEVLGPLGPGADVRQYTQQVMQRLAY